jgi:flagellar assembly protein FliH
MPASSHIIRFTAPITEVIHRPTGAPAYTREEMLRIRAQAVEEGKLAQRAFTDAQVAEMRADVQELQRGIFSQLESIDRRLFEQVQQELPALVIDLARRLLADYEPTPEQIEKICRATMDELLPAKDGITLIVSSKDAAALEAIQHEWAREYPGLQIHTDHNLRTGECIVKSRFGIVDGRRQTRLNALRDELGGRVS